MGGDSGKDKVANPDSQEAKVADTAGGFLTCSQVFQKGFKSSVTRNKVSRSRSRLARYSIGRIRTPCSESSIGLC